MRKNTITNQELLSLCNECLIYNPDTGIFIRKATTSRRVKIGDIAGGKRNGYINIWVSGGSYRAHRLAYLMTWGQMPRTIDHINQDGYDNRIINLRGCTRSQNAMNRGPTKNSKSGYKGVSWQRELSKWTVNIMLDYKQINIGYYICKHEAAKAYNEASLKYHGEFSYQNIIIN